MLRFGILLLGFASVLNAFKIILPNGKYIKLKANRNGRVKLRTKRSFRKASDFEWDGSILKSGETCFKFKNNNNKPLSVGDCDDPRTPIGCMYPDLIAAERNIENNGAQATWVGGVTGQMSAQSSPGSICSMDGFDGMLMGPPTAEPNPVPSPTPQPTTPFCSYPMWFMEDVGTDQRCDHEGGCPKRTSNCDGIYGVSGDMDPCMVHCANDPTGPQETRYCIGRDVWRIENPISCSLGEGEICYQFSESGDAPFINRRDDCEDGLGCYTVAGGAAGMSPTAKCLVCDPNCPAWYDGCNNCGCNDQGQTTWCTMMYCFAYEEPRCLDSPTGDPVPPPTPINSCDFGCTSWYDGCNNCGCQNGQITFCTEMYCEVYEEPRCNDGPGGCKNDDECLRDNGGPCDWWGGCYAGECSCAVPGRPYYNSPEEDEPMMAPLLEGPSEWNTSGTLKIGSVNPNAEVAEQWAKAALAEHASIASFSRFSIELMALGAPADLLDAAHQAAIEEVEHAMASFEIASAYGGVPVGPGKFPAHEIEIKDDLPALVERVLREGIIGETTSSVIAQFKFENAEGAVKYALESIAFEEGSHAALAMDTLRWAATIDQDVVNNAVLAVIPDSCSKTGQPPSDFGPLTAFGLLSDEAERWVREFAWNDVVVPALRALTLQESVQASNSTSTALPVDILKIQAMMSKLLSA